MSCNIKYCQNITFLLPPANRVAKVMFSVVSVRHSVYGEGGSHVTITHDALDLIVHGSPTPVLSRHVTLDPTPPDMRPQTPVSPPPDMGPQTTLPSSDIYRH